MIYCIVHRLNALEFSDFFFIFGSSITRGHLLKLMKQTSRVNSRAFIDIWNSLDSDIVLAPSLYVFKID